MQKGTPYTAEFGVGISPLVRLNNDIWWTQVSAVMKVVGSYFIVLPLELTKHLALAEITKPSMTLGIMVNVT